MKLSEYAKKNNLSYQTAWNHFKKGLIPHSKQLPSGTVVIEDDRRISMNNTTSVFNDSFFSNLVSAYKNKQNIDVYMNAIENVIKKDKLSHFSEEFMAIYNFLLTHNDYKDLLFIKSPVVKLDILNDDNELISSKEVVKNFVYKTFEDKPVYAYVDSKKYVYDEPEPIGKILYSEYNKKNKTIDCTFFIDKVAYPHIARGIVSKFITQLSFVAECEFSQCSVCGKQRNSNSDEICECLKNTNVWETLNIRRFECISLTNRSYGKCEISHIYTDEEIETIYKG